MYTVSYAVNVYRLLFNYKKRIAHTSTQDILFWRKRKTHIFSEFSIVMRVGKRRRERERRGEGKKGELWKLWRVIYSFRVHQLRGAKGSSGWVWYCSNTWHPHIAKPPTQRHQPSLSPSSSAFRVTAREKPLFSLPGVQRMFNIRFHRRRGERLELARKSRYQTRRQLCFHGIILSGIQRSAYPSSLSRYKVVRVRTSRYSTWSFSLSSFLPSPSLVTLFFYSSVYLSSVFFFSLPLIFPLSSPLERQKERKSKSNRNTNQENSPSSSYIRYSLRICTLK